MEKYAILHFQVIGSCRRYLRYSIQCSHPLFIAYRVTLYFVFLLHSILGKLNEIRIALN